MTRRAHWLRSHQTASYPYELVCFDTETVEHKLSHTLTEHRLVFGWAARSEFTSRGTWTEPQWLRFTDPIDLWRWLESQCRAKRALWTYCHNANFDWQTTQMPQCLPALGWECDHICIDDPPNFATWRKGDKTLKLLDTTNYWRTSLRELGNRVGLPKLDLPGNWTDVELGDTYCKRDVEILLVALQQWIAWLREHDLGGLGISLAQQAWKAYTHRFLDHSIYIDDNTDALLLSRDAYYGGRTEAWTVGTFIPDIKVLDVNSMYPYVMRECEYPTRLHGRYSRVKLDELARWTERYAVTARVILNAREPMYPQRSVDGLLFPVGTFETVLSTPELSRALQRGEILHCSEAAVYDKARIFTRFIDEMYELRLEFGRNNDESGRYFTKILMNSLYGKFGQRSGQEIIVGDCDPTLFRVETEIDLVTGKRYRWRYIAGRVLCREDLGESRYSHPAIAAHVTAYARMLLWDLICSAGYDNVHYMDTDSLHVSAEGFTALQSHIDPNRLGALKLESSVDTAVYYGPKDYELDGERVIKGVRRDAKELDVGVFSQSQWVSLKGATVAEHRGAPLVRQVEKRFTRAYRKGRIGADNRVSPLRRTLHHLIDDVLKTLR